MRRSLAVRCLVALTAGGCREAPAEDEHLTTAEPLIDLGSLAPSAATDPFADVPEATACATGFGIEDGVFEVDTELCRHGVFSAPTTLDIDIGDILEAVIVHDALQAPETDVSAHLGLAIGDEIVVDETIPIPADAGVLRPSWIAEVPRTAGTDVLFHVHNHGVNNYRLVAVTVARIP